MAADQRSRILLAVLAVVLAAVVGYEMWPQRSDTAGGAAPAASRSAAGARGEATTMTAPDVHLQALEQEHLKPEGSVRDPFRFKTKPSPAAPPAPPPAAAGGRATAPTGPPPPPPIAMKFIGIVESPQRAQRIAVLSDGRHVYYGREGEAVLGQYRIIRIGAESIEIAYLDGRGRQTIRLSGS